MKVKSILPRRVSTQALILVSTLFILVSTIACNAFESDPTHQPATATAPAAVVSGEATETRSVQMTETRAAEPTPMSPSTPNQTTMMASFAATETRAAEMITVPATMPDYTATFASGEASEAEATGSSGSATETPTPALERPEPTYTPVAARLFSFEVVPAQASPGEVVTLSWNAQGDSATICPTARYVLFTSDDCWAVPPSGTAPYTIPEEAGGFPHVSFILTVEAIASATQEIGEVSVALNCQLTWFFSDEPQAGICPREPLRSFAAAQRFERGTMIWLEQPGRTFVFQEALMFPGEARKVMVTIQDPLDIIDDTSADVQPPDGLFAPASGFGLIWRGDVSNSPGFRDVLGWALAPEFGYDAVLQCDDAPPSGGRSWQTCYLLGPDGEIIVFHPLGGWTLLHE